MRSARPRLSLAAAERSRTRGRVEVVPDLRFYGEGCVFEPVWGLFFRLSPSAALLLRALSEGQQQAALPLVLAQRFGIPLPRARRDTDLFLNDLAALGLVRRADA